MKPRPTYFLRTKEEYETINHAFQALNESGSEVELEVGYFLPQPQYRSWIPNWIIKLITKP